MVEQRAVKCRVEEMISQNVLLSQAANGQVGRVIVAHGQPAVLAPGYEPIHSAAVDLMLLLEGAIHDVAGLLVRWNVAGSIIRRDWQVRRKPGIEDGRILRRIERLWKCCVRRSVLLHLPDSLTRIGDAIHARKPAVQTVEAPILLIDHDDVLDFLKSSRLGNHSGARQRDRDCTQKRSYEADGGQCPMRRTGEREIRDEHVESPWLKLTLLRCLPPPCDAHIGRLCRDNSRTGLNNSVFCMPWELRRSE